MVKILIADDEHIVIESLQFIIEKYIENVEIVGSAKSGREAIEKALITSPDIILMDIHMPGINGIEAIKQIKENNVDAMFVIITAYEYFQYAKEAVNLGVYEYLLKPLNKNKVINLMTDMIKMISNKREVMHRHIILKEKINKIIPLMEGQFVHTNLFSGGSIKDVAFYEDIFNMSLRKGYVMTVRIEVQETKGMEADLNYSLEKQRFYDIFKMELKNLTDSLIGPPLLDRLLAYIPVDKNISDYEIRNQGIDIAKNLVKRMRKQSKLPFTIGLGGNYEIDHFSKSCHEAYIAASLSSDEAVTHFQDMNPTYNSNSAYPENKERLLIHKLLIDDIEGFLKVFDEIFLWLMDHYEEDVDKIKSRLIELLILMKRNIPYEMKGKLDDEKYLIQLLKIDNIKELKNSYLNYIRSIIFSIEEIRKNELNGLITKALAFIQKHYNENICLNDVAQEINMSYHYFSKFFKESTGKNFVDYLTELKIERSKELLKNQSISIKEICYEIGYSDPNYFSKAFKKITGVTPTAYRACISL
ncbi:response regulator receiver protein [Alkaliphilus metalliredigens QYMF]|uniref:Stage 0 sporulation protein A homolog n=1 Tax=Alkaliphilus metalliredigens (strain QYMF) TaxID=293826 RepID=A6TRZ8_ALKMQ|nr:response regulator [Alkaliphilus metalliredigens]ABR48966.1 response regulator receiver protein [Alkaliphilus metalliredigens QYMF]